MLLILLLTAFIWAEYQMRLTDGAFTEEVDVSDIQPLFGQYIIKHVHVLNPQATAFSEPQDVWVKQGIIKSMGRDLRSDEVNAVDGRGQYLIPGLMDGHVHTTRSRNSLWLFLVNGITHIRDMGGTEYQLSVRDTQPEEVLRPDMFVSSEKVYDTPWWQVWFRNWAYSRITISSANQAKAIVRDLVERGFDGLKISNGLTPEQYRSLVDEAHQAGLLITGHIPNTIKLDDFLMMGQHEIAHIEEITKAFEREYGLSVRELNPETAEAYLNHVRQRSVEVVKTIKQQEIHITSVIWLMESLVKQKLGLENFLSSIELAYVDPHHLEGWAMKQGWLPGHHSYASHPSWLKTEQLKLKLKLYWDTYVAAIHIVALELVKQGVPMTAGTDAVTTGAVVGFSLHDELQSMVKLGMTPPQALQTATINPGYWLKKVSKAKQSGQIKVGEKANMVLLNSNPLADISNTKDIESVIIHGRLLDRSQLDLILERIKNINNSERTRDIKPFL